MIFSIIFICHLIPFKVHAEKGGKLAVLPFKVHALKPLDHLKKGLQEMFITRMVKKGIQVVDPDVINKEPMVSLPALELEDLYKLGKKWGADWIISGSLTQIGRKISLDLKLLDVTALRPPFSVFIVEDDVDNLVDATERATTSLYNQIAGVIQIDSIKVVGNRRIESDAIISVIESRKGEQFNPDRIDRDLRAVYKMGFFKEVDIETADGPGGKVIMIKVTEKPSIGKIIFKGNDEIKDKELREECGIKPYSISNPNEIKQSINRLKEFYRQKGYYTIEIEDKIEELPQNEVSLTYNINEGEKVYIAKIRFVGNTKFDEDDLKDLMEMSEKGFFSWFTKAGLLDKKKLEFDLHKINSFYHNQGYIKAKTGEPEITYEKDKGLIISIQIDEGPQYKTNNVQIVGVQADDLIANPDELLKKTNIKKEKFFNREVVRKDTFVLREFYSDEGYAYADVSPMVKEDDTNHLVDITYTISKGEKVRFERINITGNTVTRDKVIRRELKVIEKDYFSGKDLKKSTENLHRLGFFEDVEVQTKKGSQDNLMVLDVNVKERPTGSFSIGAGYSSFDKAIGMFQVVQNNLFGYGQKLKAAASVGSRTTMYDISFTEPWLMDRPLSLEVDLYKWRREYYEFTKDSLGGALGFAFPIGIDEEFTRGSIRYGYDDAEITDVYEFASAALRESVGRNVTSSITLGLKRDSKDRPWNTSEGSVNSLSYEYAGDPLGGDVFFNKYLARSAWYFPFPWKTVFMAQGNWGYVEQRTGGKLPMYQKFYLGGMNSVRGFDFATISPKDPLTGDRIGGEKMMFYNFEYRFPLLKEQGIVGLVFFDAGNVFTKDESYSFSGIRKSVGPGIRWYSPVGPLRLEYGFNLDPLTGEKSGAWEFSVGGLF
ncbi:MAG: outer membrane protein assembly factor BamA [Pseudomonadota bacterium]